MLEINPTSGKARGRDGEVLRISAGGTPNPVENALSIPETDPERIAERTREKEIIKRRLERRCQEASQVQAAVMQAVAEINGRPGDPRPIFRLDRRSFDRTSEAYAHHRTIYGGQILASKIVQANPAFHGLLPHRHELLPTLPPLPRGACDQL